MCMKKYIDEAIMFINSYYIYLAILGPFHVDKMIVNSAHCEINSSYNFQYILSIRCEYVTDILKMCMK